MHPFTMLESYPMLKSMALQRQCCIYVCLGHRVYRAPPPVLACVQDWLSETYHTFIASPVMASLLVRSIG